MKRDNTGRVDMAIKIIDGRAGPTDMYCQRQSPITDSFIEREQERIVSLAVSGRAQYHYGCRPEPLRLAHFMGGSLGIVQIDDGGPFDPLVSREPITQPAVVRRTERGHESRVGAQRVRQKKGRIN